MRVPFLIHLARGHDVAWTAVAFALLIGGGCASFSQAKASHDQVVQGRRLTQQGIEAMHRQDWREASSLLARAKEQCPFDLQARKHYAESLWQLEEQTSAIAELEDALQVQDDPELRIRLGRMYLDTGNPTKAHVAANQAIEQNPQFAPAWRLLGDLATLRRDLEGAKLNYIRAAAASSAPDTDVQLRLASTYRQLGQPGQALACIAMIEQVQVPGKSQPEVSIERALAFRDQGRHQMAAEIFSNLDQDGSLEADLLFAWAESELAMGRLAKAEYAAGRALQLNPEHVASLQLVRQLPEYRIQASQTWRR